MTMTIRPARAPDAPQMAGILNEIIRIGGTTAHQHERDPEAVGRAYIEGPGTICCFVAEEDGRVIGFQAVGRNPGLPVTWGDIGTFVQVGIQARGIGARLFEATAAACRAEGVEMLNATIRLDNRPGLAYYARIGFIDRETDPGWALEDGRVTGRVSRSFRL
ncbi:GNAT family N-acetyltransferase [Pseudogemmobacter sonorensis]|uniref:GNAT family N-acetyltransferase n=1 Tax=Pseudogemmobacter sonorensis TaxID=2989681 RepID=UPI0036CDF6C5